MMRLRKSIANRVRRRRSVRGAFRSLRARGNDQLRNRILSAPEGPQVVAFFDMDQTLVAGNSSLLYVQRALAEERAGMADLFKTIYYYLLYRLNRLPIDDILKPTLGSVIGQREDEFAEFCNQIALKELVPRVAEQARAVLGWHRERGHRCVLLTAATGYLGDPVAEALAMDAALCTRLEVKEGRFTGRLGCLGLCYGAGKVRAAEAWALASDADLKDCFFYTDSASDLPMLHAVGVPVVVNPDWILRRWSRRKGWLACRWPRGGRLA